MLEVAGNALARSFLRLFFDFDSSGFGIDISLKMFLDIFNDCV